VDSSDKIGPYHIHEVLGRGGMGVVYRATNENSGQVVALKTVEQVTTHNLKFLRREIEVLGTLDHPNIVPIVDHGFHQGLPWYAMKLLQGQTLNHFLPSRADTLVLRPSGAPTKTPETWVQSQAPPQTTWVRSESEESGLAFDSEMMESVTGHTKSTMRSFELDPSVRELLTWIAQATVGLAFLHRHGLVHGDVKPANIMVTSHGAILMDFGLVAQRGTRGADASVDTAGLLGGTRAYMSPEMFEGKENDSRSDLYAIGCILYEIVTGGRPFQYTNPGRLAIAHVSELPLPPSRLRGDIPIVLDDLIMRLLAKEPNERIGYAESILHSLGDLSIECPTHFDDIPAQLHRTRFCGRKQILTQIQGALDETLTTRSGQLVWLSGEARTGKTRMTREIVRHARQKFCTVLSGHAIAVSGTPGSSPMFLWSELLRPIADRALQGGSDGVARLWGPRLDTLRPYVPYLNDLPRKATGKTKTTLLPPDLARIRLFTAVFDTLSTYLGPGACIFILDDLHRADELTLSCLRFIVGRLDDRPWFFLGLSREDNDTLPDWLAKTQNKFLPPMEQKAIETLVADMLGVDKAPGPLTSFICKRAGGNPFFASEWLYAAVEQQLVSLTDQGHWAMPEDSPFETSLENLRFPERVDSLVSARLEGLSPTARRVCEIAALLGSGTSRSLLFDLALLSKGEFRGVFADLERRHILRPSWTADETLHGQSDSGPFTQVTNHVVFVHQRLLELVLRENSMSADEVTDVHRRTAEALDALRASTPVFLGRLAWHWKQAGAGEKARLAYFEASADAIDRHSHKAAEEFLDVAFELGPRDDPAATEAHLHLIEGVLFVQGRQKEARKRLTALLKNVSGEDQIAEVNRLLGKASLTLGQHEDAKESLQKALTIYRKRGDSRGEGQCLGVLANAHLVEEQWDEALELYQQAEFLANKTNDVRSVFSWTCAMADILQRTNQRDEAEKLLWKADDIANELEDLYLKCRSQGQLASSAMYSGKLVEAGALCAQTISLSREVKSKVQEGIWTLYLANIFRKQGDMAKARVQFESAQKLNHKTGNLIMEASAFLHLARIARLENEHSLASNYLDQATDRLSHMTHTIWNVFLHCEKGHLALSIEQNGDRFLEEAQCVMRSLPNVTPPEEIKTLERACVEFGNGKPLRFGQSAGDFS
jgi:eukaryotic-like serine/threonine-protein kinase